MTGDRLRVLFVCQGDFGGASEKQALWFAQELARRGHRALLSMYGEEESAAREGAGEVAGVDVRWRRYRLGRPSPADLAAARGFAPDLVHAFNPRAAAMIPAVALAEAAGAPVFVHWEDDEWSIRSDPMGRSLPRRVARQGRRALYRAHPPQGLFITPGWMRWMARSARGLDALTPVLAERVGEHLGRECAVVLPINPRVPDPAEPYALPDALAGRRTVLFTGEVHPGSVEDVQLAMRAVALVQQRGVPAALVHAGKILPRYDAAALAGEAGMAAGTWHSLGYVPYAQVPALLRAADVLVQPGRPNDFNRLRLPSKMQSYLASGTPTVTFGVGFGELLEDRTEVLKTETAAPEELADRLYEALTDEALRAALAVGGPRAAERLLDPARNAERLEAHYRESLAR